MSVWFGWGRSVTDYDVNECYDGWNDDNRA